MFDSEKIGLKVGLEIHQQLGRPGDTKLFCKCPAEIVERDPDLTVKRSLQASAGELGTVDVAARQEHAKQKSYSYNAYNDTTCLVELDEEPPLPVNTDVIQTAVMVSKALKSTILPQIQFMRKTIIDGSAVSGFQRTGLFAIGGKVPGLNDHVGIQSICVEEDSAKIVSRTHETDTYNLSRLGIPLLEIATAPDIKTPEQAKEVAAQLGMILRSTQRVKRGLGTIRQDLNVSIKGGVRNEIKGCQDLRMIPAIIKNEALRQSSLLKVKERLSARKISISDNLDVTWIFKDSKVDFVRKALGVAIGFKISNFKDIFGTELCPGYRVGSEFADLAKTRGFGGIIHSDEKLDKYGVDLSTLKTEFNAKDNDAFIIVLGEKEKIIQLFGTVILPRLQMLMKGIPQEVRKVNPDATTSFLRPVPGAARMYPETDIPTVRVSTSGIDAPKLITERIKDVSSKFGVSEDQARTIVSEGIDIDSYTKRYPEIDPAFMVNAAVSYGKEILKRYGKNIDHLDFLDPLFEKLQRGKISKDAVFEILVEIAQGKPPEAVDYSKYEQMSDAELTKLVKEVTQANKGIKPSALMGDIMKKARGKADGKRVMKLLQKEVS